MVRISWVFGAVAIALAACGGATPVPAVQGTRASGQSRLIESTYAGQNTCSPKNHDRPFILEWDATDASSFEARAATDVVFVRYEGCNLQVIDTCTNETVRGSFGSYLPADWTSGALEKIDIANEAELYAKLPLGVGSLGGRVRAGEQFHMEYFVSGTRRATRPYVYRSEIDKLPGCRGVTHFVYGYNLGAFALASQSKLHGAAGATVWGIGGGGSATSLNAAEKKGGLLTSCRSNSAKEIDTCRAPIRLTLREIQDGDNPDAKAAVAPETPDALNLAGKIQASTDREKKAAEAATAAQQKLTAGDGRGCLRDLDEHDRLDPRPTVSSSAAKGLYAYMRAECLMASGQCEAGRILARKYAQASSPANAAPEGIDQQVDALVGMYCSGGDAKPRDRYLHALNVLGDRRRKLSSTDCAGAVQIVERVGPTLSREERGVELKDMYQRLRYDAPQCFARAGDCPGAFRTTKEISVLYDKAAGYRSDERAVRDAFGSTQDLCVGKPQGQLTPREEIVRAAAELKRARNATVSDATCKAIYDRGRAVALSMPHSENDSALDTFVKELREGASECFGRSNDCAAEWHAFAELYRWRYKDTTDRQVRDAFNDEFETRSCRAKPQGTMTANERVFYLDGILRRGDGVDRAQCLAVYKEERELLAKIPIAAKPNDDIEGRRDELGIEAARCLEKANACDDAWRAFEPEERGRILRRFKGATPETASKDAARNFQSRFKACAQGSAR